MATNLALIYFYVLQKHYDKYDGFVVLHGTDTMAYTASALSFMCEHLGKPIILTGSQVSTAVNASSGLSNHVCQEKAFIDLLTEEQHVKHNMLAVFE